MIQKFVDAYIKHKDTILKRILETEEYNYEKILKITLEEIVKENPGEFGQWPDPEKITVVDYGEYQGHLLFIIGGDGYQTSQYWHTNTHYGSCSGCDMLEDIKWSMKEEEMRLGIQSICLHLVQRMKELNWVDDEELEDK